jgi:hypothetical protein
MWPCRPCVGFRAGMQKSRFSGVRAGLQVASRCLHRYRYTNNLGGLQTAPLNPDFCRPPLASMQESRTDKFGRVCRLHRDLISASVWRNEFGVTGNPALRNLPRLSVRVLSRSSWFCLDSSVRVLVRQLACGLGGLVTRIGCWFESCECSCMDTPDSWSTRVGESVCALTWWQKIAGSKLGYVNYTVCLALKGLTFKSHPV